MLDLNQLAAFGPWGMAAAFAIAMLSMWLKNRKPEPTPSPVPTPDNPNPKPDPAPAPDGGNDRPILSLLMKWLQNMIFKHQIAQTVVTPAVQHQPTMIEQVEGNVAHLAFLNLLRSDPQAWDSTVNFVRAYLTQQAKDQAAQFKKPE